MLYSKGTPILIPDISIAGASLLRELLLSLQWFCAPRAKRLKALLDKEVGSRGSCCRILQNAFLIVDTSEAIIPTVSKEFAYGITPQREIAPYDGLKPTIPVYAAGNLTDPPVSVPRAINDCLVATAAALPPELPPAERLLNGEALVTGPKKELIECEPIPNSSILVLPQTKEPFSRRLLTTPASKGLRYSLRTADPQVVFDPTVAMLSFTAMCRKLRSDDGYVAVLDVSKSFMDTR